MVSVSVGSMVSVARTVGDSDGQADVACGVGAPVGAFVDAIVGYQVGYAGASNLMQRRRPLSSIRAK